MGKGEEYLDVWERVSVRGKQKYEKSVTPSSDQNETQSRKIHHVTKQTH
jgi:hypothetical protein